LDEIPRIHLAKIDGQIKSAKEVMGKQQHIGNEFLIANAKKENRA
jgi:hypothetical protein